MRAIELAKVAAAAEALRLRRLARRQAIRLALGAVAALFGLAAFAVLHVLIFVALEAWVRPWLAALILLALDVIIAGVVVTVALNMQADQVEREAMAIRHEALRGAKQSVTVMSIGAELAGFVVRRRTRKALSGPGVSRWLTMVDLATRFVRRR